MKKNKQTGHVSTHRTKTPALRSLAEDARARMRVDDPSDTEVYRWRDSAWVPVGSEVNVGLVDAPKPQVG